MSQIFNPQDKILCHLDKVKKYFDNKNPDPITLLLQSKRIHLAKNITYNPINVFLLARIILIIIKKRILGTYNIGSADSVSKYSFAKILAKKLKLNDKLIYPYNSNYRMHKRPLNTSISIKKIEKTLKIKLPDFKNSLIQLY